MSLEDLYHQWARLRAGQTVVIANVRHHPLTSEAQTVQTSREVDTRAILVVPLFKAGQLRTIVYLNQTAERHFYPGLIVKYDRHANGNLIMGGVVIEKPAGESTSAPQPAPSASVKK